MTKIRLPNIMNETLDVFSNRYVNTSKTDPTSESSTNDNFKRCAV